MSDFESYHWSSYHVHGLGKPSSLVDEAPVWERLGKTEESRRSYWRRWLQTPLSEKKLTSVHRSVTSGRPYEAESWVEEMAKELGLDLSPRQRGRPRKNAKNMN